jgi:hypothetical protein
LQTLSQTREQCLWREQPGACRCQLDRQGKPIQACTDLRDCWGVVVGDLEVGLDGLGALDEQRHGLILRERHRVRKVLGVWQLQHRHRKLALGSYVQRLPACDKHFEPWAGAQQLSHLRGSAHHVLEVVQQQQQVSFSQRGFEVFQLRLACHFPYSKRLGDRRDHQVRVAQGSQGHEPGTIGELVARLGSYLQAQARFADASRTRECEQTHLLAQEVLLDVVHYLFASNEGGGLDGKIVSVAVERLEGWKGSLETSDHQLIQMAGIAQVLEAVFSQVLQADIRR